MSETTKADDDQAADEGDQTPDPRLRAGQNEASVAPNPRSFLNADEAKRHADDQAAGLADDGGPRYDPLTGKKVREGKAS